MRRHHGLPSVAKARVDPQLGGAAIEQIMPRRSASHRPGAGDGACVVEGDRTRLIRVVCNLVSNAIRYTPEAGKITVAVRARGTAVIINMAGNCIGIAGHLMPSCSTCTRSHRYGPA
jgi:signal transduction histidine kinase